jgi:hypothetical protein
MRKAASDIVAEGMLAFDQISGASANGNVSSPIRLPQSPAAGLPAAALHFDLDQWDLQAAFQGAAPPERWLVSNSIPLGEPGLLAAMGDTGKGMLGLELAFRVAGGRMDFGRGPILGGHVEAFGNVVIFTAEDSAAAVHRRLRKLDPDGSRQRNVLHRMVVVPLPNAGGSFPLIVQRGHEIGLTPAFGALREQLVALQPRLVIFDPLQSFCQADLNADPSAGSVIGSALTMLATELDATILIPHHMRKPQGNKPIETAADAREMIRGTTALVDSVRFAYAIWPEHDAKKARTACDAVGRQDDGHSVYRGGIAKANGASARGMHTLVRDGTSGVLQQLEYQAFERQDAKEVQEALVEAIAAAAREGHPFGASAGSLAGLFSRRAELTPPLNELSKSRLSEEAERLVQAKRIVRALKGGNTAKWLDVPEGPFAQGHGEFAQGARTGRPGRRSAGSAPGLGVGPSP